MMFAFSLASIVTVVSPDRFRALAHAENGITTSSATAVSSDGDTVVGYATVNGQTRAWRWRDKQLSLLPDQSGHTAAVAVSADGGVIAGHTQQQGRQTTAIWRDGQLTTPVAGLGRALGVSADGLVIWGSRGVSRESWIVRDGTTINSLPNAVVGWFANRALLDNGDWWSWQTGKGTQLGLPISGTSKNPVQLKAYSAAAKLALLHVNSPAGHVSQLFSQKQVQVQATDLGSLDAEHETFTQALALSADGHIIVGTAENAAGKPTAVLWNQNLGLRSVQDLLRQRGTRLPGWWLETATGVSADGRVIVGWGINPDGVRQAWQVQLGDLAGVERWISSSLNPGVVVSAGRPIGVGRLPDGRVLVLDQSSGRLMTVGSAGVAGPDLAQFKRWTSAVDLVVDALGIAVLSTGSIDVLDHRGRLRYSLSFSGQRRPAGLDRLGDGFLVSDRHNDQIISVSGDGTVERVITSQLERPGALRRLPNGQLVVIDRDGDRVQRFGPDGRWLDTLAHYGSAPGQVSGAADVQVADAQIIVTDGQNHRLQRWALDGRLSGVWGFPQTRPEQPAGRLQHPSSLTYNKAGLVVCAARPGDCRWFSTTDSMPDWQPVASWQTRGVADWDSPMAFWDKRLLTVRSGNQLMGLPIDDGRHGSPKVLGRRGDGLSQFRHIIDLAVNAKQSLLAVLDDGHRRLSLWRLEGNGMALIRSLDLSQSDLAGLRRVEFSNGRIFGLDPAGGAVWQLPLSLEGAEKLPVLDRPLAMSGSGQGLWVLTADPPTLMNYGGDEGRWTQKTPIQLDPSLLANAAELDLDLDLALAPNNRVLLSSAALGKVWQLSGGETQVVFSGLKRPQRVAGNRQYWAIAEWGQYRYQVFSFNEQSPLMLGSWHYTSTKR